MKRLLLVDDQPKDIQLAAEIAEELGIEDVLAKSSVFAARSYLEKAIKGEEALPGCMILDLDLGVESGFELLRFWHSTRELSSVAMIVWSVVDEQRELCKLFKVDLFVSKWQGAAAIRDALEQIVSLKLAD